MPDIFDWKLQFGAFAIAAMLIGLLVWHIRYTYSYFRYSNSFLRDLFHSHETLQRETNHVLADTQAALMQNAHSTQTLTSQLERMDKTQNRLLREMLQRPCLLDAQVQDRIKERLADFEKAEAQRIYAEQHPHTTEPSKCPNTPTSPKTSNPT